VGQNVRNSAVRREFKSKVPAAEEMLDGVVCSSKQLSFSFRMRLESGDGSGYN